MSGHAYPVNIHRASDLSVWLLCALITDKEHTHTHTGACTDAMTGGVCKCSMCMWDSGAWVHECSCPCSHVEIRVQGPLWRCVHVHRQAHMHWPAVSTLWCLHFFHSTNHSCISLSSFPSAAFTFSSPITAAFLKKKKKSSVNVMSQFVQSTQFHKTFLANNPFLQNSPQFTINAF